MADQVGTLRVERAPNRFRDAQRRYRIVVDRKVRGKLREGEVLELELPAGEHSIQARVDWTGSRPLGVLVSSGERVELVVEPAGATLDLWRGLTRHRYIVVREKESPPQKRHQSKVKTIALLILTVLAIGFIIHVTGLIIRLGGRLLFGG